MAVASGDKNSISVTVRVRPFTIREAAQLTKTEDGPLFLGDGSLAALPTPKLAQKGLRPIIKVVDDRCLVFDPPEDNPVQKFSKAVLPQGKRVKDQTFMFDRVFDETTSQGDVYEATTKNLLDNVFDGYNATVFAYGATGCGKTHTITGTAQQPGIIFLTMQELFERISDVQGDKVTEISLSYLEIYNETIRDLLVPEGGKTGLMLREDSNQAVTVAGLSSHHPQNVEEVMDMIVRGNEYRTMSPTEANATSSRSHAVLQINVSQKDRNAAINEPHTMATLSIIDLAGSERAIATKNRGERLLEGANINKSLLALGSCINALCEHKKGNHVPYRNSKLTRLLKFSLGGNCKTVMIVCVSPSSQHFDETQNTLRYANRAKNIQTKVTRNVYNVNRHVKDFLKKIDEQMAMINELKQQQKEHESIAFGKFSRQNEKRQAIVREGLARLRAAYDHSEAERKERLNNMKKLRQIERRITLIQSWLNAFEGLCESRDEEEPPVGLVTMQKTARGVLIELESSRHHHRQRLNKDNWQRSFDTALQTGLKQLQEAEATDTSLESNSLVREAELMKANAEREMQSAMLEQDKSSEAALVQALLQAHFETVATLNHLLTMDEQDAVVAAKNILGKLVASCVDVTSHAIKPDGSSLPTQEAFPPSKAGTPRKRKSTNLITSPPSKPRLEPPLPVRLSSPVKASPRRVKLGSAKKVTSFTPKKKSPRKRVVRWRDDTEEGKLAEWSKTPQKLDSTPDDIKDSEPPVASFQIQSDVAQEDSSPTLPEPPKASFDIKPPVSRFQAGFLSRKAIGSPRAVSMTGFSSSPDPSPLQEVSNNNAGRLSSPSLSVGSKGRENDASSFSSDSEKDQGGLNENKETIKRAVKRASMSRLSTVRDQNRVHRRRSPPAVASSPNDNSLFGASHARRMAKIDRDPPFATPSLSSRMTPMFPTSGPASARRATTNEAGLHRRTSRGNISRLSALPGTIGALNTYSNGMANSSRTSLR